MKLNRSNEPRVLTSVYISELSERRSRSGLQLLTVALFVALLILARVAA